MPAGGIIAHPEPTPPGPLRRGMRRFMAALLVVGVSTGLLALWSGWRVQRTSAGRIHSVDDVPPRPIAMVLGAKAHPYGPSSFLAARLDLAVELYERGTIRAILVSGDGGERSHNEPAVMKRYLVQRGVPAEQIVEDPAGFDTYDSCVRARDVYGVTEFIIISQDYHLPRALTIAHDVGLDAVGVGDLTMKDRNPGLYRRGVVREWLANLKMEWDLATRRKPRQDPFNPALLEAAER